jgi:hypothetical protein
MRAKAEQEGVAGRENAARPLEEMPPRGLDQGLASAGSAQSAEYGPGASGSAPITDRHTPRKRPRQSQPTPLRLAWWR